MDTLETQLNKNTKAKGSCKFCCKKNYTTQECSSKKIAPNLKEQVSKESIYEKIIKPEEYSTDSVQKKIQGS